MDILNSCSNCHKKMEPSLFKRPNWKNTATRIFKTCNDCNNKKRIKDIKPKMDELFNKVNKSINFISPFNNII